MLPGIARRWIQRIGPILSYFLPCGKAGRLQIPRCQGFAVVHYNFTLSALTLKPSDFCNVGVQKPTQIRCFRWLRETVPAFHNRLSLTYRRKKDPSIGGEKSAERPHGQSSFAGPATIFPWNAFLRTARLSASGGQAAPVFRGNPNKTVLRLTPFVRGDPEAAHMEPAVHQELLETLTRLRRPDGQTPLFAERAATGPDSFTTIQTLVP